MKGKIKLYQEIITKFEFKDGVKSEDIYNIINKYSIQSQTKRAISFYINKFIEAKECECLSSNTIGSYRLALNRFSKFCSEKNIKTISSVSDRTIKQYVDTLKLKSTSINYYITVIRIFFKWLEEEYIIEINPCNKIKYKCKKVFRHSLSAKEVNKIRNHYKDLREETMIEFMLCTGCRVSELINIKLDDIDFLNNQIVVTGKGNKQRVVLFSNKVNKLLSQYLKKFKRNDDYLFCASKHPFKKLTRFAINAQIKKIAEAAGIKSKMHPHIFRHTFATVALNRGMDIVSIQKLLGHENLSTTQIYAEIDMNNVKKNYNKSFNE